MIHAVRLQDCPETAWRNGGGVTRELLTWPPGAPHWQLRVSVATIDRDGPFSALPGVARAFAVLDGDGVCLGLAGGPRQLRPGDPAAHFDGAEAPMCTLLGGATRDLNLMATAAMARPRLRRAGAGERAPAGPWCGLYVQGRARLQAEGAALAPMALDAGTLAWSSGGTPWSLLDSEAPAWWLSVDTAHGSLP